MRYKANCELFALFFHCYRGALNLVREPQQDSTMLYQSNTSTKPNILIVDDDATIRLLMRDFLSDETYSIEEAENGSDALQRIKQHQPDLVLLDVNMPGINGFEVCDEIRKLYGDTDISIVMVTGLDDSASIEKAYALGATDFIGKPMNWNTFPYRIQYLIKARNAILETKFQKEQEVHNNKMEAIGQLTSGIAHDFGNLMTVAKGNLDLLQESIANNKHISTLCRELIEDAHSAVIDGVELTKQLLAFSRKKSISPVSVNIENTINKFHKLFKNTVGQSIILHINIYPRLPNILVDPAQFESSLLNIIINARNAMPDGGKLSINAKIMVTQRSHEIICNADNDLGKKCICIYIKDDGLGMGEDVLKRAIEPFYTTSSGTGLGLSMVYGFIKQSGGELIIHSKPLKGTTIYLQFPIVENIPAEQTKEDICNTLPDIKATILIVEDQPGVRQFAARCLNKSGINILLAQDAAQAKALLETNKNIDLLFTDILMPGNMNGHELASWAHKKFPELKILLTTATEDVLGSKQTIRNHGFELLPKPYNKFDLTEKIRLTLM